MNVKNKAIENIQSSFRQFANLILNQLELLEKIMNCKEPQISDELLVQLNSNEKTFDQYEIEMSEKFINSIVLYKPVASDLRKIMAIYRMSINLERIGDLIMNIVLTIRKLKDPKIYAQMSDVIFNMLVSSINMVEKSLLSFSNVDRELAIWTIKNDSVIDEMNHKLLKKTISKSSEMSDESKNILLGFMGIRNIITNIERIADNATNIAEASIYSLDGTDLRHTKMDDDNKHTNNKSIN
ncbi:MAG: phosphate uptake regulator PhoU [Bacteroidales bacterium]|jgi:phosphate transport system protein|nr:phosphate uptake regulator PhoU [Bacteroidales bacterium]